MKQNLQNHNPKFATLVKLAVTNMPRVEEDYGESGLDLLMRIMVFGIIGKGHVGFIVPPRRIDKLSMQKEVEQELGEYFAL
jgi:hypothetical protein